MLMSDLSALNTAIEGIKAGKFNKVDLGQGMKAYKVPSNNPNKYTIRVDIKVEVVHNG